MSQSAMYRYPSMTSVHSMASMGHLPPGHGYIPRRQKPDKPYGPSFVTIMNRTWRGPGKTYLIYALVAWCIALLFFGSAGLYFGHRNVSRMMVLRTEVWGAIFIIIGILATGLTFHFIWKARLASNDWRRYTKFRPEGLSIAAAYNHAYVPEDGMKLATGTYGPRALKEIPRPKRGGARSRKGSQRDAPPPASATSTTERRYEKKAEAQAAPVPKGSFEDEPGSMPYSDAPPAHGSMEYLASEPRVLGYEPPPAAVQSQPQGMTAYQDPPPSASQPQGYQPSRTSAFSAPPPPPLTPSYQTTPSSSRSQGLSYQPPAGPEEPLSPRSLGYQPPPGPDDPTYNLYAQPTRRQRPPTAGYPDSHVSVSAFSPMPASPTGQAAQRYSMEDMYGQPTGSTPSIPVHGLPTTPGLSESEL